MDVTPAGGIKAAIISGEMFNNKDDKKGHQDTYCMHFQKLMHRPCNFPDTSNICYHCYCTAGAELIAYTAEYIRFLKLVKMAKDKLGQLSPNSNIIVQCMLSQHSVPQPHVGFIIHPAAIPPM